MVVRLNNSEWSLYNEDEANQTLIKFIKNMKNHLIVFKIKSRLLIPETFSFQPVTYCSR